MAITSPASVLTGIPSDFPKVIVCNSASELGVLLGRGVHAWQAYRDNMPGDGG